MEKKSVSKPVLTEETIQQDAALVARIKSAKPLGKPMSADQFAAWLDSLN
jgi:hypothetical protein